MSDDQVWLTPKALARIAVRLVVAVLLLSFVFRIAIPEDGQGIVASLRAAWQTSLPVSLFCFGVAFTILGISFAIGASRFSLLLTGADVDVPWRSLFRAYLIAGFFNLVLPGAILGDVYRLWDVREQVGAGSRTLGIIVVERLLSLTALGCLGLVAAPFLPLSGEDRYLAILLMALCGSIALATAATLHPASNQLLRRVCAPLAGLSKRLGRALEGALAAVADLSKRPGVVLRAFVLSLLNQGLPVLAVFVLAIPLAGSSAWYWFAIIVPFVTLVSLVPISIGGTGVREYLYVALFGAVGMPSSAALALSLSILATAIVWALVGFMLFVGARRETSPGGERRAERLDSP